MKLRRLGWFSPLFAIVALSIGVRAQERGGPAGRRIPASFLAVRNEFILRAPADRIAAIAARRGLTVIRPLDEHGHNVFLVSGPSRLGSRFDRIRESDTPALQLLVDEVQGDPDVAQFEVNSLVVTPEVASSINLNGSVVEILDALTDRTIVDYFGSPAWQGYANQPATTAIHLAGSRGAGATGAGIVAIIDTGVDPHHPLIRGSLVPGYDFVHDVAGEASEWTDVDGSVVEILDGSVVEILDQVSLVTLNGSTIAILKPQTAAALNAAQLPVGFGHGTMVAGLVHLVAPTAKIMPLKAFKSDGTSNVFDVVRAINYAVEHGARVINMSFSATAASPEIAHAINEATSRGVICVASAGNSGLETLVYPGALRNVVGVGSTTTGNPPARSWFSNFGDALVTVGAPGEGVITTFPGGGYAAAWGTSFSAPITAGSAALLLQVDPALDQASADSLLGKADRMAGGMGRGRLNLDQSVRTLPDAAPPAVTLVSPTGGVLFGDVLVSAFASDNVGVSGVSFLLDDSPLSDEDTAPPYQLTWTTTTASNGSHVLTAVARDVQGNQTAASVTVTVANDTAAPTVELTSPEVGAVVGGTLTVSAAVSDDVGVVSVRFLLDGAPLGEEQIEPAWEVVWDTTAGADGAHTLTAIARDEAGHETRANVVSVTVQNNDVTAPTVAMLSPAAGSNVTGSLWLVAAATDNVAVAGVRFAIDGAPVGPEDATAPYRLWWNTRTVASGPHTVTAVARDAAGNQATATSITLIVWNYSP
jgi:subtilisin family serine protease